jgi:hypothetical protein
MRYYLMLCDHFRYHDSLFETKYIHILESTHTEKRTKNMARGWMRRASGSARFTLRKQPSVLTE